MTFGAPPWAPCLGFYWQSNIRLGPSNNDWECDKVNLQFNDTSEQMSKRLATGGVGNWGSHLGGDVVSGELDDGHLYLGISLHF